MPTAHLIRRWLTRSTPLLFLVLLSSPAVAQEAEAEDSLQQRIERLEKMLERQAFALDATRKRVDDLLWFERLGDLAIIDKVYIPTVPNPRDEERYGITNERHPIKIWCYVFTPREMDTSGEHPMLVFPHGGVHGDFTTYYTHIVRELMQQGYVVIAPEYRGSTGYGRGNYEAIDYGGLEVDDVVAARDWALEYLEYTDSNRVGIMGWSHGGLIALMSVFDHPEKFRVAYAGVPVSDLVSRMGYTDQGYRDLYEAEYHIGKSAEEDTEEYRRRSPAWNAHKLQTPLLIHTSTNDRDVNVLEVEHLIKSLKAEGKDFRYRIYEDAPGGHSFNRLDTVSAKESREEIYEFLREHLQ